MFSSDFAKQKSFLAHDYFLHMLFYKMRMRVMHCSASAKKWLKLQLLGLYIRGPWLRLNTGPQYIL